MCIVSTTPCCIEGLPTLFLFYYLTQSLVVLLLTLHTKDLQKTYTHGQETRFGFICIFFATFESLLITNTSNVWIRNKVT